MLTVNPKKHLSQHFLYDEKIAKKIVQSFSLKKYSSIVELGPGMGMLTHYIIERSNNLFLLEKDKDSVKYLHRIYPNLKNHIINMNFLQCHPILSSFILIGNFPYNISSKILFYLLKYKNCISECVGMFQKEMAERIISAPGTKTYGILSIFIQAFYEVEYIFTIPSIFFSPKPNVRSSVIRFHRKSNINNYVNESILYNIVKKSFKQRRKKLRNTLKPLNFSKSFYEIPILDQRAEDLSVQQFIQLSYKGIDK